MMFGRCPFASVLLILAISQTLPSSGRNFSVEDEEFCERETFEASCPSDEVILIRKALFGRMNLGRCVETGYGKLGCSADALTEVEGHCSGRQRCQFPVGSLHSTRPCPAELISFLLVSYDCVKVMSCSEHSCNAGNPPVKVSSREGYLASVVTMTTGCGSESCPWVLPALPGQRFNLTFRSFGRGAQSEARTQQQQQLQQLPLVGRFCQRLAAVAELSSQVSKDVTLCDSDVTEVRLVTSANDEVKLKLYHGTPENPAYFIVRYEVIGCPDPEIPQGAVVKRSGNLATVSCHGKSTASWHLTCNGVSWSGRTESCVANPPSHHDVAFDWSVKAAMEQAGSTTEGILVVVGLGVIIGILVGCFLLAVVVIVIRRRRRKQMLQCERRLELLTHISPGVATSEQHGKFHEQKPSSGAPCDFHQVAQSLIYDSGFGTYEAHGCPPPPPRFDEVSTTNLALLQNSKMASDAISYAAYAAVHGEQHHMYESRSLSTQA